MRARLLVAALALGARAVAAQPTGLGLTAGYSRAEDPFLGRVAGGVGAGIMAYNDLSDVLHGYAVVELYKGEEGGKYEIVGNLNILFVLSPNGSAPGLRPFAGAGAGIGGGERWSGLLAAGVNWNRDGTPLFLQSEYAFRNQRIYIRVGFIFDR